ncbi:MAG TPA: hypothetical protein VGE93_04570 [Bryobacteraceae bacterium]
MAAWFHGLTTFGNRSEYDFAMGVSTILMSYQARLVALHGTAAQLRLGHVIAIAVMSLAIAAIVLLAFLSVAGHRVRFPLTFVPIPVAVYAGAVSRKRHAALIQVLRLESYYPQELIDWRGDGRAQE